eukprot:GEMP01055058.1.p1 GENE.GEMP01055058.1~~GEMP01055058.1.p1  ORF type:complete len:120 (+),score=23.52 GEMP01055058.1:90-449(+)
MGSNCSCEPGPRSRDAALVYVDDKAAKDKKTLKKGASKLSTNTARGRPELNGTWVASDGSERCSITGGSAITWPHGLTSELVFDDNTVMIVVYGKEIHARVSDDKITWDDGDEWILQRS